MTAPEQMPPMSQEQQVFDFAVVGAGPSGSIAALLLSRAGYSVALVSQPPRTKFCIGETLSPRSLQVLTDLRLHSEFSKQGHTPALGVLSSWGSRELRQNLYIFDPYGSGWHLDRAKFDLLFVEAARDAGAHFIRDTRVTGCVHFGERWSLQLTSSYGPFDLMSRFLVDAAGRTSALPGLPARRIQYDNLVAAAVVCDSAAEPSLGDCTVVEAVNEGWFYCAPIPHRRCAVVYMTDADLYARGRRRSSSFFQEQLDRTTWVSTQARHQVSQPILFPAMSSIRRVVAGENWLSVGDAARSFDPLSSQGIADAMQSGIDGARTAVDSLAGRFQRAVDHERRNRRSFAKYLGVRKTFYEFEHRWPESEFWRRRQDGPVVPSILRQEGRSTLRG